MKRFIFWGCSLALVSGAWAQDSVSMTPGGSDALSPYTDPITVRYVVDLVPVSSSWGNGFVVGPVLKASADNDPLFSTQLLGSAALSPDQLSSVTFASTAYSLWTSPGAGVNPTQNAAPGSLAITGYDRQFGVAFSDLATAATNVVGALVGQDAANPTRLFVTRVGAMSSRGVFFGPDSATLSLGAVDAAGNVVVRADDFNSPSTVAVHGENIARIGISARSTVPNTLLWSAGFNNPSDFGSTSLLVSNGTITTNTPSLIPDSAIAGSSAVILDFANSYLPDGGAGVSTHLDPAVNAHRGNPSFSAITPNGGVGTVASLGRTNVDGLVASINFFGVDATGAPTTTRSAKLPSPISDGTFSTNAAGTAQFLEYLSQTSFRGGNGQVALGLDPSTGSTLAAATATDPIDGQFIAVATFGPASVSWTIAAHVGTPVLDGSGGLSVGAIAAGVPVSMSSPAIDLQGNIYFVASFQPTIGPATTGLFKAVNSVGGYELELLLKAGDSVTGANSTRSYTIDRLTLGDSDSVASGSVFSASVLQPLLPGAAPAGPSDPLSFGGIIANASIIYNNAGTPETYQAVLFLGPGLAIVPFCPGDANGDGIVNFADITAVVSNWLATSTPGSAAPGDANNDGTVNFGDITTVVSNWLVPCP